jgi:hypothetical protein
VLLPQMPCALGLPPGVVLVVLFGWLVATELAHVTLFVADCARLIFEAVTFGVSCFSTGKTLHCPISVCFL